MKKKKKGKFLYRSCKCSSAEEMQLKLFVVRVGWRGRGEDEARSSMWKKLFSRAQDARAKLL
jgi:hypothetical protein